MINSTEWSHYLVLKRRGDFYEAYGNDARTLAQALNITLTGRTIGGKRVAMAGIPHHAAERYVTPLVNAGFKVALVDDEEGKK